VALDRFDRLVENAPVLDVAGPMEADAFFLAAAAELSPHLSVGTDELAAMLRRREEEGSTMLSPSMAVPHVVIPGEKQFGLLLARARDGVHFAEGHGGAKAIFVLAGTSDERNFHLRALAAIAQTVQEKDFERRWMAAANEQALRDVILLSERGRQGGAS
jgi:mannitol/fructose-specific phosphotransferase system IIA component (Ntr-type)